MADDPMAHWPCFKLVTYSAPTGIPHGWDAELLEKGAPDGLICRAAHELTLLEDPGAGPFVCFGFSSLYGRLCLDPSTRQVMHILYGAVGAWRGDSPQAKVIGPPSVVGSSLDHFIALVRAATLRFPFDSDITEQDRARRAGEAPEDEEAREDRRFNEWAQAALELEETLKRIDPAVSTLDGDFWWIFLADVDMGIYASESWLNPPEG